MSQGNRQNGQFTLTTDQRSLLDMYVNFYNHATRQMESLHDLQSEIQSHINQIVGLTTTQSNRNPQNFNEDLNNNLGQNNYNNIRSGQNGRQNGRQNINPNIEFPSNNSRVVYIEGVPYLLDLTNFMRLRNSNNTEITNLWRSFYENIAVSPSRAQIENSTRVLRFSEITDPINNSCPITLERFDENSRVTQFLHCGHIFTPSGINSWLNSNVRCPVCRHDIRDYRVPIVPDNLQSTSTRENRHSISEPGNDEEPEPETNEELEEDDQIPYIPPVNERESNSTNRRSSRITSENITNVLSNITENILNNILPQNTSDLGGSRASFERSQNSLFYDSSNNQFVFEGFIRR